MDKKEMKEYLEELYAECKRCVELMNSKGFQMDRRYCEACPIGAKCHRLELELGDKWQDVDWNSSNFEEYYHH